MGSRGGISDWTTLKDPGVASVGTVPSEGGDDEDEGGEEGMYSRMGTFFSGVGVLRRRLLILEKEA